MPTEVPILLEIRYYEAAQEYLRSLPMEHFMESTAQSTQRRITLASLELVTAVRPDFQVFNELLVQYPLRGKKRPGQVVPDNMVVIHDEPIEADGSYDVPLQPARPFWVLEYVSKSNRRKDYDDNKRKYEHELKVPYYLLFAPDKQELTLYHHTGRRYQAVKPDARGRSLIPELDMEVALLDGWVRFWHRGELLPLPRDLKQSLEKSQQALEDAQQAIDDAQRDRDDAIRRAEKAERELAALRARGKNGKN